jgi:TRAP-type mannitol/chloroaromatic compound transport system permease small subunit
MNGLLRLARGIDRITGGLARVAAVAIVLLVVVGAFNAILRTVDAEFGTQFSSNRWLELQWYLFSVAFLLGGPWALSVGAHVRVDVLHERFPRKVAAWIDLVGTLVLLLPFCTFAMWVCWDAVAESWRIREVSNDPDGLARYPIKTVPWLAFGLLGVQGVAEGIKRLAFLRGAGGDELLGQNPHVEAGT